MKAVWLLLLCAVVVACQEPAGATPTPVVTPAGGPPSVFGTVTAGPVCPVEMNQPDLSCGPRPVAGAVIVARDTSGQEVARVTTGADGSYTMVVPRTGAFLIAALPEPGLIGVPAPVTVILAFPNASERVDLRYDTGIR